MFDSTRFLLFLTAGVLLAIAPGPGMLYVLARSLAGGKREGVLSAVGTFFGGMVHVFAAALGVSIVLAKSAVAFATVKYVGAAYLCFLGVRMILDARKETRRKGNVEAIPQGSQARAKSALAGRGDGSSESQDRPVLPFVHSAVCESRRRARVSAVRGAGNDLGGDEHHGRFDCDRDGGTAGRTHSLVGHLPAPAENRDRSDHDRAGDLSGDQREQVAPRRRRYNSRIWWSWQSGWMASCSCCRNSRP